MIPLSDFLLYVRPEVSDCPEIQLKDAVLRAGIDFCKKTTVVTKTVDITTVVGQAEYAITGLDEHTEVDEIIFVKRPGTADGLVAANEHLFDLEGLDDPERTNEAKAYYLRGSQLVLGPVPSVIETFRVKVKIRPTRTATELPDELGARYAEAIAYGAKAKLMAMRNKPWTDLEGAALNAGQFEAQVDKEKLRHAQGGARAPLRVKPHWH